MGSRHNRKRTRSRPRNRQRSNQISTGFDSITTPAPLPQTQPRHPNQYLHYNHTRSTSTSDPWQNQYVNAWQAQLQRQSSSTPSSGSSVSGWVSGSNGHGGGSGGGKQESSEEKHLRMFGGVKEDGMVFCDSMVQVMLDLFDGRMDYADDPLPSMV